ncbi:hypothetical protein J2X58_000175 [Luteibacter sp. 3190]|nr:hypothetical protein [Luteibacter sp. 3190]
MSALLSVRLTCLSEKKKSLRSEREVVLGPFKETLRSGKAKETDFQEHWNTVSEEQYEVNSAWQRRMLRPHRKVFWRPVDGHVLRVFQVNELAHATIWVCNVRTPLSPFHRHMTDYIVCIARTDAPVRKHHMQNPCLDAGQFHGINAVPISN